MSVVWLTGMPAVSLGSCAKTGLGLRGVVRVKVQVFPFPFRGVPRCAVLPQDLATGVWVPAADEKHLWKQLMDCLSCGKNWGF